MIIAHNISAINTYKSMGIASTNANKSMEKLSSGYRINRAGDDAAGLSISEKMRSQIRGLNQASRNAQDGISMIQTAEGALNEGHSILQRMRELAVQAATDTNADIDREALQNEMGQLTSEINRIANTTEFNGMQLLTGDKGSRVTTEEVKSKLDLQGITYTSKLDGVKGDDINIIHKIDASLTDENEIKYGKIDVDETGAPAIKITITFNADTSASKDKINNLIKNNPDARKYLTRISGTLGTFADADTNLAGGVDEITEDRSAFFHVGANKDQVINMAFDNMSAKSLGLVGDDYGYVLTNNVTSGIDTSATEKSLDISTRENANIAIGVIDNAIKAVSSERSKYGAVQNRIEYTINNLNATSENLQSAESRIRDVDMASEMMEMTKNNILQQASQAMLSQSMQRPQQALQLLQQ